MTIRQQTIKVLSEKYGVDLKTATDEEMVTLMEYYKLNGTARLFNVLRSYEHDK